MLKPSHNPEEGRFETCPYWRDTLKVPGSQISEPMLAKSLVILKPSELRQPRYYGVASAPSTD
jgi:hypothetical protein